MDQPTHYTINLNLLDYFNQYFGGQVTVPYSPEIDAAFKTLHDTLEKKVKLVEKELLDEYLANQYRSLLSASPSDARVILMDIYNHNKNKP